MACHCLLSHKPVSRIQVDGFALQVLSRGIVVLGEARVTLRVIVREDRARGEELQRIGFRGKDSAEVDDRNAEVVHGLGDGQVLHVARPHIVKQQTE